MDNGRSHIGRNEGMQPFVMGRSWGRKRKRAVNLLKKKKKRASTPSFISPTRTGEGNDHYDVFLSFRGSDTRKGFADHLYHSLDKAGIVPVFVFRDDKSIPIGEEFGPRILDAIARSKISILVISENYASSKWCLRELIHIMDHRKRTSHIVLPIFYKVNPSDVRRLKGSFGNAFRQHKKYFDEEVIQKGPQALEEVSYLHGWESEKVANGHEGELVKEVIENVLSKLRQDFQLDVSEHLVGIDDHVNRIMKWVDTPTTNVQMIGIYGMGGIGKTTLAKVIYNQLSNDFKHRSFLADIRETACRDNIVHLQKQLIKDILQIEHQFGNVDDGISWIKSGFKGKKVLILLDDIDHEDQLNALARERNWFTAGSIIMVTTRYEAILDQSKFNVHKYDLNELDWEHALLLFNRHAFYMDHSSKDFEGLSRNIVSTMGGLPLALKVVGSYLHKKLNRKVWEDVWKQLKSQPHRDVQKILRISYDALEDGHQQIFLDIVCFFIGKTSEYAMYMWEDGGLYPSQGIEELKLRCLIKIGRYGQFEMHDQLRDLGRSIFCQGQPPEKRSGPWDNDYEGVPKVLRTDKWRRFHDFLGAASSKDSMELFSEVRWLELNKRLDKSDLSLSTINLHLSNLSILELSNDMITEDWQVWISFKASKRLKVLYLWRCDNLICTPDLSAFTQLKILRLFECRKLEHLHPSIGKLTSLVSLNLIDCSSLKELPKEMGELKDLEKLLLYSCDNIREIPNSIGDLQNLHDLNLEGSAIKKLPIEIGDLPSLKCLNLSRTPISDLPESVRNLSSLQSLDLHNCEELRSLPKLPSSLQSLDLHSCEELRSLPKLLSSLQSLDLKDCKEFRSLPELPSSLTSLDLRDCKELRSLLPELPSSLQSLDLRYCMELRSLPKLPSSLQSLDLSGCKELRSLPELPSSLQSLDLRGCKELRSLPELPSSLQSLYLWGHEELQSLPELPSSLQTLYLCGSEELRSLPELPSSLQTLDLKGCKELRSLPELPSSLQSLDLMGCEELRSLPELPSSLQSLDLTGCEELRSLPKLHSSLQGLFLWGHEELRSLLKLHSSLQSLDLWDHEELQSLPELHSSFQSLYLWGLEELRSLPEFPSSLQTLYLCGREELRSLPELPSSLQTLYLNGCKELQSLPELPSSLQSLDLKGCKELRSLPELPSSLQSLDLTDCKEIRSLPELPSSLQSLDLTGCKEIRSLPELPSSLQSLDLKGCKELQSLPELPSSLQSLDLKGCKKLRSLPELPSGLTRLLVTSLDPFTIVSSENISC